MPDMTGFEVLERLKANAATRDIPVVICTSRILTVQERNQLTGRTATILSKQGLDHSAVVQELLRVVHGAGVAATIH
jgi:CheY-like chemotaxis protein